MEKSLKHTRPEGQEGIGEEFRSACRRRMQVFILPAIDNIMD